MQNEKLWEPTAQRIRSSQMASFAALLADCHAIDSSESFWDLYQWSVKEPGKFWKRVSEFCGVKFYEEATSPLVSSTSFSETQWFPGAKLNFAENLLRFRDDRTALISVTEQGDRISLSYADLYREVSRCSRYLRSLGVKTGDRVAGYLPNIPESIIAMLAASSIGAIWSSCSPDFGAKGVLDRFGQIEPTVLFAVDGYYYNGKSISLKERLEEIERSLPSLKQIVLVPFLSPHADRGRLQRATRYGDCLAPFATPDEIEFAPLPFNHPLYIMYSSGTTGAPKCIVHGAGGTLLQHLKELQLHNDLRREDTIFYFSTCGWMMWNWLVSSLAVGATVVLYDGSPFAPSPTVLIDMAQRHGITVFGTSAKYLAALEKAQVKPRTTHALPKLRAILSTGSPLLPESFDFVYRDFKNDVQLASISGGTDIISCFVLGNPYLAVHRGEIQGPGLGMRIDAFDEEGCSVRGKPGELVCTQPFPSMPIYFWNDPDGSKYRNSYFATYDNVWRHGDWIEVTEHGGYVIYGRSDAVLNPGGVRIGTAEIYSVVEQIPEIVDSLVVGQKWEGDERVVLFVKMRPGSALTSQIQDQVRSLLRAQTTPRHVPAKIIAVPDIPRTISGKIVELAVRNLIHDKPVTNRDALANPEALDYFVALEELQH